jgi:hypothetical protein
MPILSLPGAEGVLDRAGGSVGGPGEADGGPARRSIGLSYRRLIDPLPGSPLGHRDGAYYPGPRGPWTAPAAALAGRGRQTAGRLDGRSVGLIDG